MREKRNIDSNKSFHHQEKGLHFNNSRQKIPLFIFNWHNFIKRIVLIHFTFVEFTLEFEFAINLSLGPPKKLVKTLILAKIVT